MDYVGHVLYDEVIWIPAPLPPEKVLHNTTEDTIRFNQLQNNRNEWNSKVAYHL